MDAKRQKTRNDRPPQEGRQLELSYPTAATGEAPRQFGGRVEASASGNGNQSPTVLTVMQEVLDRDNLIAALDRVMGNKGAPGVDGMSIEALPDFLLAHWPGIKRQLLEGTYQPQPVRRVDIPKPDGGSRQLGIPTVLDRLIQQAVQQVLTRRWDPTFSPNSFGFRPGRSAHQAIEQAQRLIAVAVEPGAGRVGPGVGASRPLVRTLR